MKIYIGADHGGYKLKERLKEVLKAAGHEMIDKGTEKPVEDDDYPDFASAVARELSKKTLNSRGILICRSGFGMDIVANKFDGIRAALASSSEQIKRGRHDDDVNVLVLASDFTEEGVAIEIANAFLTTPFAKEDRYSRRLEKIVKIEAIN